MATHNPFQGMSEAKANKSGTYYPPNFRGLVRIKNIQLVNSQQKNAEYYVIETEILESTSHPDLCGLERSVLYDFAHGKTTLANIRAFLASAMQVPYDEVGDQDGLLSCQQEVVEGGKKVVIPSPFVGVELRLETLPHTTKKGGDFTLHRWGSFDGSAPEEEVQS